MATKKVTNKHMMPDEAKAMGMPSKMPMHPMPGGKMMPGTKHPAGMPMSKGGKKK